MYRNFDFDDYDLMCGSYESGWTGPDYGYDTRFYGGGHITDANWVPSDLDDYLENPMRYDRMLEDLNKERMKYREHCSRRKYLRSIFDTMDTTRMW